MFIGGEERRSGILNERRARRRSRTWERSKGGFAGKTVISRNACLPLSWEEHTARTIILSAWKQNKMTAINSVHSCVLKYHTAFHLRVACLSVCQAYPIHNSISKCDIISCVFYPLSPRLFLKPFGVSVCLITNWAIISSCYLLFPRLTPR